MDEDEHRARYFARYEALISSAVAEAINYTLEELPDDPLFHIGAYLTRLPRPAERDSSWRASTSESAAHDKWTTRGFLTSLNLPALVADALLVDRKPEVSELQHLRGLDWPTVNRLLVGGHHGGHQPPALHRQLAELVWEGVLELRTATAVTGLELHTKFLSDPGAFELSFGGLSTFFGGLEQLIGPPQPNLREGMRRDHCAAADAAIPFRSSSYGTVTTSITEWFFVVKPEDGIPAGHGLEQASGEVAGGQAWPDEVMLREDRDAVRRRRPIPLAAFDAERRAVNARLRAKDCPPMCEEELIAGRLYTGPTFVKYNSTLRAAKREGGHAHELWSQLCLDNMYVTTLHVINSATVKLSKLTVAGTVYRGLSGAVLPARFWEPNDENVVGGVELAFMSTTRRRDVALEYATRSSSVSIVLEIQQGMVDRGASLQWLSQYPHEEEILFNPLTGLEITSTKVEGAVLVVQARRNARPPA